VKNFDIKFNFAKIIKLQLNVKIIIEEQGININKKKGFYTNKKF